MQRDTQYMSIGGARHMVRLRDTDTAAEYVMLRSYAFKGDALYDTDLYFIEKSLFSSYIEKKQSTDETGREDLTSGALFPVQDSAGDGITVDIRVFNQDLNAQYFDEHAADIMSSPLVYSLYRMNSEGRAEPAVIKCRALRIARPHTAKQQNLVVHCYARIGNIKAHIICRDLSWYNRAGNEGLYTGVMNETREAHAVYTEYTDVIMPDVADLFGGSVYYRDNMSGVSVDTLDDKSEESARMQKLYDSAVKNGYTSLAVFKLPYTIKKQGNSYIKEYIPDLLPTAARAQLDSAITARLIPYDSSVKYECRDASAGAKWYERAVYGFGSAGLLVHDSELATATTQFYGCNSMRLKSKIGFQDNKFGIINVFEYKEKGTGAFETFKDAYEYYNGVDLSQYTDIVDDEDEDGWWDPDYNESMQCGAVMEVFRDKYQKDRIYKESYGFRRDGASAGVDDFMFDLKGLFTAWGQWPGILFARCSFIDKYIGKRLHGNIVTITKEQFKFLVNGDASRAVANSTGSSIIETESPEWMPDGIITENNVMDKSRFNLLSNIRVNIVTPAPQASVTTQKLAGARVIYRPVFYKTHDTTTVKLKYGLTQNIGVNLMDWMTKVETFKMLINGVTVIESARNDNYVIFNIDANKVLASAAVSSGEYHLLNQDDEYITSGAWSVS